ncbi:E3 ubiquitin/ISG15 ligase TRIM25-like [Leptodactylus fuscus]|uniref:E3 ubiquitin/ISG15 ligase TRIM25-like n=1 Tax=Leptodactylus fuscus TaxID=238119 RepID=UPI003F4E6983
MASSALRDELDCPICLSTYRDPVTLRCGHNFCRVCIDLVLDTKDWCGVYFCPECRVKFRKRPVLVKNHKLCNIVERFMSTEQLHNEVGGICCTYCIHSHVPAVKSCLHCEASLCDNHMRVHSRGPEHVLTEPCTNLENRKCPFHKKVLEYYCIDDATCICMSCSLAGEHRGHQIELLKKASLKKKEQLKKISDNLLSKREENVSRVQALSHHKTRVHEGVEVVNHVISDLFEDIRRQMDNLERKILNESLRQQEQVSLLASDLIQKLETENENLSKTMSTIQQMVNVMDPLTVLKDQELNISEVYEVDPSTSDDVHNVADLDMLPISKMISSALEVILQEVKSKGFKMPEVTSVVLDIDTAGYDVAVSEDLQMVSWLGVSQNRPNTPETFQTCQVLSKSCFSLGVHFLEVESDDRADWCVGMSYASIDRKGEQCIIGHNAKSWGLRLWNNQYSAIHGSKVIQLPALPSCKKLGMFLDYETGRLFFYEMCDPMKHLHTFKATFTEPLHVLCWVMGGSLRFRSE